MTLKGETLGPPDLEGLHLATESCKALCLNIDEKLHIESPTAPNIWPSVALKGHIVESFFVFVAHVSIALEFNVNTTYTQGSLWAGGFSAVFFTLQTIL